MDIDKLIFSTQKDFERFCKNLTDIKLFHILNFLFSTIKEKEIEISRLNSLYLLYKRRLDSQNNYLSRLGQKGLITGKE